MFITVHPRSRWPSTEGATLHTTPTAGIDFAALGPTLDLTTAAALLGIGRTVSYALVREDRFPVPVLRVGRIIRVPTAPLLELLGIRQAS